MVNINAHLIHHPFVNPQEMPMPTVVLPGGGRLAIYPTVKTRYPGPSTGVGPGVSMGMPHPLGSHLGMGCGVGIGNTAAAWRRYYGLGGMLTGYPLHGRLPGRPGLGGYWSGWQVRD